MDTSDRQQTEQLFRRLLETAPDAMVITDRSGKIILVNSQTEKLFGYTKEELLGQAVEMLVPERFRHKHSGHRTGYFTDLQTRPMGVGLELYARRKDGSEFPAEISLSPLETTEGEILVTAAVRDITERKQAEESIRQAKEEAERANRAKNEFLSRMSHELRTPLNAILGFSQLLEMDQLTPEQQESVAHILKGGRHLLELINEVLDIARIESGQLRLSPEPVNVKDVAQEALDLIHPLATSRKIQYQWAMTEAPNYYVLADRQRLKQVLLNLVSNAVKYNHPEGTVTLACQEVPGRLRLEVSDTGPGILPERMDRLFTPFDRLGAEQTGIDGSGLGLALSKRLVEAMNGTIGVKSTWGSGSTFWVELPLAKDPDDQLEQMNEELLKPAATDVLSKTHILLYIEDNLSNLKLVERVLAHRPGIKILSAMQGQLGLDLAREHRPDLILLDLNLPDLQGDEVLQRLQENPDTSSIPVLVISADATPVQIKRFLAAGVRGYLTKPLDIKKFLAILDEIILKKTDN
ncbi:PAS domain S-box protein [Candidatus Acetothermia bacterium]|nr:PAS domain S-box protein [Candidatus Acetothermia bacterium]